MKIKTNFSNLKFTSPEIKFFCPYPIIFWAKDEDEENEIGSLFVLLFIWGFSVTFIKKTKPKTYAICKHPIPSILTREKEYEIIKKVGISYVLKRDDDSIDKISASRFYPCYEK